MSNNQREKGGYRITSCPRAVSEHAGAKERTMTLGQRIEKTGTTPDFIFGGKYAEPGGFDFDLTVTEMDEKETDRGTEFTFSDGTVLEITDGATIVRRG